MKIQSFFALAFFILLSLGAGWVGSAFTLDQIGNWYASLVRPSWTPPNWVFGPVWTSLYVLMGTAAYLVSKSKKLGKYPVLWLFVAHLLVNTLWSIVFFALHEVLLAVFIIVLLIGLIILMMRLFWRHSHVATYLLVPYLLWCLYASSLNIGILVLN